MNQNPLGNGECILLVEDEPSVLRVCTEILKALNYKVVAYEDPKEALDYLNREPQSIQLLLVDHNLGSLSGSEMISRARLLLPGLPAILCTGMSAEEVLHIIDERTLVLTKPVGMNAYAESVAKLLSQAT